MGKRAMLRSNSSDRTGLTPLKYRIMDYVIYRLQRGKSKPKPDYLNDKRTKWVRDFYGSSLAKFTKDKADEYVHSIIEREGENEYYYYSKKL